MSTENIREEVEAARKALGKLDVARTQRLVEIRRARKGLATERARAKEAYETLEQSFDDQEGTLDEEESQLAGTPDEAPAAPAPPVEPEPAEEIPPTPEPTEIAPEPEPPAPPDVVEPPTEPAPAAPPVETVVVHHHVLDVRTWTQLQWLFAIGLALMGLVLAAATDQKMVDDVVGFGRGFIIFVWWTGLISLGFGLGGMVGWLIERRLRDDG